MLALGVYFAALLEFWLCFCPLLRVERLALGKQIVSATGQTVGQLKFLFQLTQDGDDQEDEKAVQDLHVESSVKFFLLHPIDQRAEDEVDPADTSSATDSADSFRRLEQFVGPHLGENLAWRVQEVARKLDMCKGESVQSWLREHYSDRVQSHIVLRGYLFYPLRLFGSTSEVTLSHDWEFHPNPAAVRGGQRPATSPNPSIALDHLRGWWTSDIAADFQAKVLANDREQLGESRFVVLPKLHWLSPVLASEEPGTTAGKPTIAVDGEPELGIQTLTLMTLPELMAFAKTHFSAVAASPEVQANGAVVMPLLVSELVRCRPGDLEFDESGRQQRWKELSRGFVLDPRYWDPNPLCHNAVRFKRVNNDVNAVAGEREYEGRREWVHNGVIKPSDEELAKALKSKQHVFSDPGAMTAASLCEELLTLFATTQKVFTHANLKQSIGGVFQAKMDTHDASSALSAVAGFTLDCLTYLVCEEHSEQQSSQLHVKLTQRVGHLVLDAFEALKASVARGQPVNKLPWRQLFLHIAEHKETWSYLTLALRAVDVICELSGTETGWPAYEAREIDKVSEVIQDLLSQRSPRWNGVAVETMKVIYLRHRSACDPDTVKDQVREVLDVLMEQQDWTNSEQLTVLSNDLELLQLTFKRFSRLNLPKAMKRLRNVLMECHAHDDGLALLNSEYSGDVSVHAGSAIDHELNRTLTFDHATPFKWEFVDTSSAVNRVLELLENLHRRTITSTTSAFNLSGAIARMVVGLDCEWRPQFLSRGNKTNLDEEKRSAMFSSDDTSNDEDELSGTVSDHEGLSVYQLAVGDNVFVVDVQALGEIAAKPLHFIWEQGSSFVTVGFCVSSDLKRMSRSFPGLLYSVGSTNLLVELKQLALYRQIPASTWGLSQLSRVCIEDDVDKEQQCSDWGARPLSPSQLEYAAKDAFVVRQIALHLLADAQFSSSSQAIEYLRRFAVVTRSTDASFGHWVSAAPPLDSNYVRAAIRDLSLEHETSFRRLSKDDNTWDGSARTEDGLVIKTIAVLVRSVLRGGDNAKRRSQYAAVVVSLDRSIDMQALGNVLGVDGDDLGLADKEVRKNSSTRDHCSANWSCVPYRLSFECSGIPEVAAVQLDSESSMRSKWSSTRACQLKSGCCAVQASSTRCTRSNRVYSRPPRARSSRRSRSDCCENENAHSVSLEVWELASLLDGAALRSTTNCQR